ncbi:MAG: diguanylate cyclase [Desulfobulbaceae bacterium]|jgi:diguanylate cyclase (GGDEF)-like protein|nr:diguanylate cyclase [Desulfobulbaceae bacterium]
MPSVPETPVPPAMIATTGGTELAQQIVDYLLQILGSPRHKDETIPEQLRAVKNIEQLSALAWSIRKISLALANGDLEYTTHERGVVIGGLKALQSNLRHLTWQAKQIAVGDYSHRVDFIGEFSESFNIMTEQLANRITTLANTSEKYRNQSFRDHLTGIYNRVAFMHYAQTTLGRLREENSLSTLIITDIDKFKHVNDHYGHLCGDEVLRAFTKCLLVGIRPSDLICRYGGEEFLILLPDIPLASGRAVAERLRLNVADLRISHGGQQLTITASFGLTEISGAPDKSSFNDFITNIISRADVNLYKAKEAGRNRVVG